MPNPPAPRTRTISYSSNRHFAGSTSDPVGDSSAGSRALREPDARSRRSVVLGVVTRPVLPCTIASTPPWPSATPLPATRDPACLARGCAGDAGGAEGAGLASRLHTR